MSMNCGWSNEKGFLLTCPEKETLREKKEWLSYSAASAQLRKESSRLTFDPTSINRSSTLLRDLDPRDWIRMECAWRKTFVVGLKTNSLDDVAISRLKQYWDTEPTS